MTRKTGRTLVASAWTFGGLIDRALRHPPPNLPFGAVRGHQDAHGGFWHLNLTHLDLVIRAKRGEMVALPRRIPPNEQRLLWLWLAATVLGALAVGVNVMYPYPS